MPDVTGNNRLQNGQFIKGQSGNPSGRPKNKQSIPDLLRKIGSEVIEVNGERVTIIEAVCRLAFKRASEGHNWAMQFIADRTEGKPMQPMSVETHEPIQLIKTGIPEVDEEE